MNSDIILINSVEQFVKELNDELLKQNSNKKTKPHVYFRGQNSSYTDKHQVSTDALRKALCPNIYRNGLVFSEEKIFRDAILSNPDEFAAEKSTMEKLVRMQHYGMPTRLMDITSNSLIALYFACEEDIEQKSKRLFSKIVLGKYRRLHPTQKNYSANSRAKSALYRNFKNHISHEYYQDGFVFMLNIPEKNIKYFDSDTVSVVANIARMPKPPEKKSKKRKGTLDLLVLKEQVLKDLNIRDSKGFNDWQSLSVKMGFGKIEDYGEDNGKFMPYELLDRVYPRAAVNIERTIIDSTNEKLMIELLLHEIREEKPYFKNEIVIDHLSEILCVKPLLKNRRIIRQDGAFLLFGISLDHTSHLTIPQHWMGKIFRINKSKKKEILEQLEFMGVSKDKVYPELEKVAEYLKSKYSKEE